MASQELVVIMTSQEMLVITPYHLKQKARPVWMKDMGPEVATII